MEEWAVNNFWSYLQLRKWISYRPSMVITLTAWWGLVQSVPRFGPRYLDSYWLCCCEIWNKYSWYPHDDSLPFWLSPKHSSIATIRPNLPSWTVIRFITWWFKRPHHTYFWVFDFDLGLIEQPDSSDRKVLRTPFVRSLTQSKQRLDKGWAINWF